MAVLEFPAPEDFKEYPSLGPQLIEFYRVQFGVELTDEQKQDVCDWYAHYPMDHEYAGQRRFDRCALEVKKGVGKTTVASIIAVGEAHPWAPCRFNGYREDGTLLPGRPVKSPYVVMLAVSQEQVGDLAYGMARTLVAKCPSNHLFKISKERITVIGEGGIDSGDLLPISNLAGVQEGKNITHWHADEPHRMFHPGEKSCYETLSAGLASKRADAEPWMLATSTAGSPSEPSVQLDIRREAEELASGEKDSTHSRFRFRSRWAGGVYNLDIWDERGAAFDEAQGPQSARGTDRKKVCADYDRSGCDRGTWERLHLNRWTVSDAAAYPAERVRELLRPKEDIPHGAFVTVGFDGAKNRDATAIVITEISSGRQELVRIWERPDDAPENWEVDATEVDETMTWIFKTFDVWRAYCDPPFWTETVANWAGRWTGKVVPYETKDVAKAVDMARCYLEAINDGTITFVGRHTDTMFRHVASAGRKEVAGVDEFGQKRWRLQKLNNQDRYKFDACMAGNLSWKARLLAIADGATPSGGGVPRRLY